MAEEEDEDLDAERRSDRPGWTVEKLLPCAVRLIAWNASINVRLVERFTDHGSLGVSLCRREAEAAWRSCDRDFEIALASTTIRSFRYVLPERGATVTSIS